MSFSFHVKKYFKIVLHSQTFTAFSFIKARLFFDCQRTVAFWAYRANDTAVLVGWLALSSSVVVHAQAGTMPAGAAKHGVAVVVFHLASGLRLSIKRSSMHIALVGLRSEETLWILHFFTHHLS